MRALAIMLATVGLVSTSCPEVGRAVTNDTNSLLPDLGFRYACGVNRNYEELDVQIERCLAERGFTVINRRALQIKSKVKPVYEQSIVALREGVIVSALKIPGMENAFVIVNSPPPTVHHEELERDLINLFQQDLGCIVIKIDRNDNSDRSFEIYRRELGRVQAQIIEAGNLPR